MKKMLFVLGISILYTVSYAQLKVYPTGRVSVGEGGSSAAALNVKSFDNCGLHVSGDFTFGFGDNVKSTVEQIEAYTFAGYYRNERNFFVSAQGWIYSKGVYLGSDEKMKTNIKELDNSLGKILKMRGVSYEYLDQNKNLRSLETNTAALTQPIKHIGVIAQEIKTVVPELVKTMDDGTLAVAYPDLSGLFIEAFKEQQKLIDEQRLEIESLREAVENLSRNMEMGNSPSNLPKQDEKGLKSGKSQLGIEQKNNTVHAILYQNIPNPFTTSTEIRFYIPKEVKQSKLLIFDLQGRLLKEYLIGSRGKGSQTIQEGFLKAGKYIYMLLTDGLEVDSKTMILTSM